MADPGESRSAGGLLVSAFGAVVLAVAVFLPWYGVSFTARGVTAAEQAGDQFALQYGNATLQSHLSQLHDRLASLVGHELFALSAHQALSRTNFVLLVLAGLGLLIALLALAGPASASSEANRVPLALLGLLAAACVAFRMLDRPSPAGELISLSLREGAWLALLGALCMAAGALWKPRPVSERPAGDGAEVWSELSGWSPES
jgi:hypothetical protein